MACLLRFRRGITNNAMEGNAAMRLPKTFAATLLFTTAAFAQPGVMGHWEGRTPGEDGEITVKIAGLGDGMYRGVLEARYMDLDWRGELTGIERAGVAAFAGKVSSEDGVMEFPVLAQWVNSSLHMHVYTFMGPNDDVDLTLKKKALESPTAGAEAPEGAVVLFDGDDVDAWHLRPGNVVDGAMKVTASAFESKQAFGDHTLHVEFKCPYIPEGRGQHRGNSGVYVQGRYEIQVLDSFGEEPADNLCGGIYQISAPRENVSYPPGLWQTYDIDFTAPKFDEAGNKTANARITVRHNGVVIHDDVELPDRTPGGLPGMEAPTGPLFLQNHGEPVEFRNIWVVER